MKTYQKPLSHVELRVPSLEQDLPFYRKLLSALGFMPTFDTPAAYSATTQHRASTPNHNALGFGDDNPAEAERIARLIGEGGGKINAGPRIFPIRASQFTVFFEDPYGNHFEGMRRLE